MVIPFYCEDYPEDFKPAENATVPFDPLGEDFAENSPETSKKESQNQEDSNEAP